MPILAHSEEGLRRDLKDCVEADKTLESIDRVVVEETQK